jgi:hypothetical protein
MMNQSPYYAPQALPGPAGQIVNGCRRHHGRRRAAGGELDNACRKPDTFCVCGDIGKRGDRVGAISLSRPDRIIAKLFSQPDSFHRQVYTWTGIAD